MGKSLRRRKLRARKLRKLRFVNKGPKVKLIQK